MEIPVVEDVPGEVPASFFGAEAGVNAGGAQAAGAFNVGPTGNNTHLWVAGVMLVALVAVAFLHISGFRFATDIGITRR
jgi:hypothetical protein